MNIEEKGEISLNDQRPSIGFHQSVSLAAMAEAGQPAEPPPPAPRRPAITAGLSRMQCAAAARAPQGGRHRIQCAGMRREIELKK